MKFTLSWLKKHLETTATVAQIEAKLSTIGLEVESIENPGEILKDFKVVEVVSVAPHPDADRLRVCQVNTGEETLQIVCGAPNARAGIKAVLARPGHTIPSNGMTLKPTKIRGVDSQGMMCSAQELGLKETSDGIIEVPLDAPVGVVYADFMKMDDPIFDIAITPNRGDCLSIRNIARDLVACGLGTLKSQEIVPVKGSFPNPISIERKTELCPLFAGRLIKNVKNVPSPEWLKRKLEAIGVRSISALVDVTNFLSYDMGRPMHAFDASKIKDKLVIRISQTGEKLKALDDKEYTLNDETIVVADAEKVLSIGGIMGGMESGCTDQTTDVYLESALFDATWIAKAGRQLNLLSDSRYRFERGVDPAQVLPAMERATQLIMEICGGEASEITISGEVPVSTKKIHFNPDRVRTLGGLDVGAEESIRILKNLGFESVSSKDGHQVSPPSWRHDIEGEADLVEEILRIKGLDSIPVVPLPTLVQRTQDIPTGNKLLQTEFAVRRLLAGEGMHEAVTYSFVRESYARAFGWEGDEDLRIANPIHAELEIMRPSLLPNLLEAVVRNQAKGQPNVCLFEVGAQYKGTAPQDQLHMASGVRAGETGNRHWDVKPRAWDVFDAKRDALLVLEACGFDASKAQIQKAGAPSYYHPGRSGVLSLGPKNILAYFGELHPQMLKMFDLETSVSVFEVFLEAMPISRRGKVSIFKPSPFQAVVRDFAFLVDRTVSADDIVKAVLKIDRTIIQEVNLFDVYTGEHVESDKKSVAVEVVLQPQQATFTDEEIQALSTKIIESVSQATGGVLRG